MKVLFQDRRDAGRQLGTRLQERAYRNVVVLALPRGGVPVGYEVARMLRAPLDVFVVRKLGVPGHEELAMGAIASGGVRVLIPEVIADLNISARALAVVTGLERAELARRERLYRGDRPYPALAGATAILVDDGVATGASMLAAIEALRQLNPAVIVAAAPLMSQPAYDAIHKAADACETLHVPEPFAGVGAWYGDFSQTSDEEVEALLKAPRAAPTYAANYGGW